MPEFSFNLIAGGPGAGKTTLAHQIMFAIATPERPALYFTVIGEPPLKMLRYQQQFAFFDTARIGSDEHVLVNLSEQVLTGLDQVLERIVREVDRLHPAVWLSTPSARWCAPARAAERSDRRWSFVQRLALHLTSWQATTVPDRRVRRRSCREPGLHRGRRHPLAVAGRRPQLGGPQAPGREDARPGADAGAAHLPHHHAACRSSRRDIPSWRRTPRREGARPAHHRHPGLDELLGGGIQPGIRW